MACRRFVDEEGPGPVVPRLRIRAVIVVVLILFIRSGSFRDHGLNRDRWRAALGLALLGLGLAFAI